MSEPLDTGLHERWLGEQLEDSEFRAQFDASRALLADDGLVYWRRQMHSRCDPARGIHCPWCDEFTDELERQRKLNEKRT